MREAARLAAVYNGSSRRVVVPTPAHAYLLFELAVLLLHDLEPRGMVLHQRHELVVRRVL